VDELLAEFLTEMAEKLTALDLELVKLEQDPQSPGLLANIFRLVHTIKGTSGFIGLPRLELLAHAAENVLGRFRDGELVVTAPAISVILAAVDRIKAILAALEATEAEPEGDDAALIGQLDALAEDPATAIPALPAGAGHHPDDASNRREPVATARAGIGPAVRAEAGVQQSAIAAQTIRVNLGLLESLMRTVSELVLCRNQLLQIARRQQDSEFAAPLQRLNQVVSELQESVMKTRMQPIGAAWAKLPRLVRDLAYATGKKIDLVAQGSDTELDRQVLELVRDPLTHIVRNAVDHGIEPPEERRRAGKPETGLISLRACHQGGHIAIEISDDGRGVSADRIKARALAEGLASEAELVGLTEAQIQQLIFRPGFTTAGSVSSVSGRGVGMDVVRTNIEKIGGAVELSSRDGLGAKFTMKIPLTLTIISALIVEAAGERFAIPQTAVIELVRSSHRGSNGHRIERVNNVPLLRLRGRLLPLVVVEDLLKLQRSRAEPRSECFVVVLQAGAQLFGLIVDQVFDTEEIVVKPLARVARNIAVFSGNTILGDGSVIMILDPGGIALAIGAAAGPPETTAPETGQSSETGREKSSWLVFRAGADGVKAVPLRSIARLEEFERKNIESVNDQRVIQYRGKLMPLVPLALMSDADRVGRQPALVFAHGERMMALLVDAVIDIVETEVEIHPGLGMPGSIGRAIIAGRVAELIDAGFFCRQVFPDWSDPADGLTAGADASLARAA
jgi:two-component system chemotaxis sensor kinase CheA